MRVPGLEEVLQRLREAGDARLGRGAEEREVAEVEQGLGLSLHPVYRSFLL